MTFYNEVLSDKNIYNSLAYNAELKFHSPTAAKWFHHSI